MGTKPRTSHQRSSGGERPWKEEMLHERGLSSVRRILGTLGETCERRDGAHMGFSERINTILN